MSLHPLVSAGAALAAESSQEAKPAIAFDIPAQPLAQALDAYGRVTGMAALVDQGLSAGRRSAGVEGVLTPDQALRILVAGTGLTVRYASSDAFTLESANTAADPDSSKTATALGPDSGAYFADLQGTLIQALCRRPETRPGRYRLGIQLWIGSSGVIRASHLLDSSGNPGRDAAVTNLLKAVAVAPPPAALPQPVTIVLRPQQTGEAPDCHSDERQSE